MRILGIDYGLKKVGLAISDGKLADPLAVIKNQSEEKLIQRLLTIINMEKIAKVVVGVSEGQMGEKTLEFVEQLKKQLSLPIATFDETLSTYEAKLRSRESGMKRLKRTALEDAFAASILLQAYLENQEIKVK